MADDVLRIYTDGACSGNPGPGGWAWASSPGHTGSGGDPATTNNKMELMAVLRAIEDNPGRPLVIVMDSTYVKDGLEKWSKNWARNNWLTKDKKPVKNQEIWKPLVAARDARAGELTFEWVKGHSGHPMNDLVDELAVRERDAARAGLGGSAGAVGGAGAGGGGAVPAGAAKLADLPPEEQRAERRRRDGRIPSGHLLLVVGHAPPELGGWDPNPVADRVRDRLREIIEGQARMHPDLRVLTGLRPGTETLAAEAAIRADVPYVAVLPFADPDRQLQPAAKARFADLRGRAVEVVQLEKKRPDDLDGFRRAMGRRDAWLTEVADEAILVWDQVDNRLDPLFSKLDRKLGAEVTILHP
jgi:ribonuclease HI